MEQTDLKEKEVNPARMNAYQFLSRAFIYPEEDLYSSLREEGFAEELNSCFASLANIHEREVSDLINSLACSVRNISLENMQSEFSRIFGHSVSNECPPYETEYGKSHVFQKSQGLGDIAGFYKAFGLEASDKAKERHDHISIELEFMYFLIFKENYARENSRAEESDICKDAQKKFLKDHLGIWVPLFTKLLGEKAGKGFYKLLAELTGNFMRSEIDFFKIEPEEIKKLGSFKDFDDDACALCGGGDIGEVEA
ncbi:MAG: hypothetical protein A3H37_08730 [Candidatus Schekmanbacteria bacterium RIFCSPLOWO2_02_FULL_38_14]|uniref:Molecular chaperone TorD n=1 Tax=Candidatus Schekmanbacteria bacterium RIFCSPLOWO2_12_FULL_38_15 TaxID=1817883 RepID=A0A1F7SMV0_9BACT|nr:MAG: hypothetical protein A3H37_08730 [Candidatus Schekmanbacteria bacterium RIFCSPLOWO2_02_FULL_38_14]OGL55102.1 MAG: hypothetical protein A3G31_02555 [Candidatus Schekmanbacteria bacterium RIFCSPLOWO2_12_FULL_38_15]